ASTYGNNTDQLALTHFKSQITHDPLQITTSWNSTTHFCNWPGITCGRKHPRVPVLDLRSSGLSGSISPAIGNLSFLRKIYLQNNSLTGRIPPEIGRLSRLEFITLRNNSLSGEILPGVFNCSNLVFFTFAGNLLSGKIPDEIGSLSKLKRIGLDNNSLTGSIPESVGNMSSLEEIYAYRNYLVGTLPVGLGQSRNFSVVSLYDNHLSGTIPDSTFNSSTLVEIDLELNKLTGQLPSGLGLTLLPQLEYISLPNNRFSGQIPVSLSNATHLGTIRLGLNWFSGRFPSLEKINELRLLAINSNNLGTEIPRGIENLINLRQFEAHNNNISGIIPSSIGKLQSLEGLNLGNDRLSGFISSSLGNLTKLVEFHLETNHLQGSIPNTLGNCKRLLALNISQNSLDGSIPIEILLLPSLAIFLDLSHNRLSSSIPVQVGNLKNLGLLRLSDNMLSGKIPNNVGSCIMLEALYMDSNNFSGSIPQSLSSLRGIRRLNVSRNNLSGQIPDFFQNFSSLKSLDLSYNNFHGVVPSQGIFKNPNSTLISGNVNLCGGIPDFRLPKCKQDPSSGKSNHRLKLKIILISSAVWISAVVIALICFLICRSRKKQAQPSITSLPSTDILQVSYDTLFKATDGFSPANEIGRGGSGTVYKGILTESIAVAVKVLNLVCHRGYKSFVAECEALRNARHRNLVKVVTVCSSVDHHGNDFKAIVYEFMENGSLDDWLHNNSSLNMIRRLNIGIDVGLAIEYLHNGCETPIMHWDLKPSNVRLDHQMTGRVSDFGLAKLVAAAEGICFAFSLLFVNAVDAEYGTGDEKSTKEDVYSYGILMLEMFTGKMGDLDLCTQHRRT
ncbi:Probable LRR receptor-like serine/threonine-protein kinase At3g47570, partial [Linum grandiflorum]